MGMQQPSVKPAAEGSQAEESPVPAAVPEVLDADIEAAARIIAEGKVAAFTGAGVSAESGVPTYRDPGGLWRKYDMKKVSHIKSFLKDPISCWRFELELYRLLQGVRPNAGHVALAELEEAGLVTGIVTQNVEGLHTQAGSRNVIELHGNETQALCLSCGERCSAEEAFQRLGWVNAQKEIVEEALPDVSTILCTEGGSRSSSPSPSPSPPRSRSQSSSSSSSGRSSSSSSPDPLPKGKKAPKAPPGAPSCPHCTVGLLKPDAIYFGEKLDTPTLKKAEKLFGSNASTALLIGSSCSVAPASVLPVTLRKKGGKLIEINPQASRLSKLCDVRLRGPSAEVLPRLLAAVQRIRAEQEERGEASGRESLAASSE